MNGLRKSLEKGMRSIFRKGYNRLRCEPDAADELRKSKNNELILLLMELVVKVAIRRDVSNPKMKATKKEYDADELSKSKNNELILL